MNADGAGEKLENALDHSCPLGTLASETSFAPSVAGVDDGPGQLLDSPAFLIAFRIVWRVTPNISAILYRFTPKLSSSRMRSTDPCPLHVSHCCEVLLVWQMFSINLYYHTIDFPKMVTIFQPLPRTLKPMANNIGQILRLWRKSVGLTQEEVAARLGCSRERYKTWETNTMPPLEFRIALAQMGAHGLPGVEDFLAVKEPRTEYGVSKDMLQILIDTLYDCERDADLRAKSRTELYRILNLEQKTK